ncbi:MAG: hypothetical protein ACKVP3_09815 [Hyphomicrobiaceae bacterium]
MFHVGFDRVTPATALEELPIHLEQSTSHASVVLKALLLVPALAAVAVPLALLGAHAMAEPAAFTMLADHPMEALQIGLGLVLWCALFVWPLRLVLARAGTGRVVDITVDMVRVTDRGPLRSTTWSEPLGCYRGVAHTVRSSLSGVRHEMILVHADPRRHVLLAAAPSMPQSLLTRTASLLNLPEVAARDLYAAERRRIAPMQSDDVLTTMPAIARG